MVAKSKVRETGCCKPFNPKPWDKKTILMKNRLFLKAHVTSFFHIPINFGSVMVKSMDFINKNKLATKTPFMMVDESGLFGSDLFIEINEPKGKIPVGEYVKISGTFLSRVYEGPYSKMGEWIRDMDKFVVSRNKVAKKVYFFYTMCPACAKAYGQNYTVILAEV